MTPAVRHKYELKKPIAILDTEGNETKQVTELLIRTEVCAGDLCGAPLRDPPWVDDVIRILGRLSGQPDVVLKKLSIEDLAALGPLVGRFLGAGPTAGSDPSLP